MTIKSVGADPRVRPENTREGQTHRSAPTFKFSLIHQDPHCHARTGIAHTAHGDFETPVFMPVGTQGTVKSLTPYDLESAGVEVILANAYHLYIRPGIDIISAAGGLHGFMGWNRPILTDSGGFQVFSLTRLRKISEEGVAFHSHFDGKEIFLTPEKVIEIQEALGSDIAMIFDECPPLSYGREEMRRSLDLTVRWSARAKQCHSLKGQALFGIIQGGIHEDLRLESLEKTVEIGFDGYALGGLCVGETKEQTFQIYESVVPKMPAEKPRYLMGIGTPLDLLFAIEQGADMFDCVTPTRYGRTGTALTDTGLLVVRNGKYQSDPAPLAQGCGCYTCSRFSRSYLRHLFNAGEMLGPQLVSLHNVHFFTDFVKRVREAVRAGRFMEFKKNFLNQFDPGGR